MVLKLWLLKYWYLLWSSPSERLWVQQLPQLWVYGVEVGRGPQSTDQIILTTMQLHLVTSLLRQHSDLLMALLAQWLENNHSQI